MARILQVCNTDFYLAKFLVPLVRELVAAGHVVECVCEVARGGADLSGLDVRIHPFEFPRTNSPVQFVRAIARMRALLHSGRYDCVNGHNRNASIVARIAAWLEHVPVNLYTAHGFYFHDDQGAFVHGVTVVLEAMLARITDFTLSQSTEDVAFMTGRHYIRADRIIAIGNGIDTTRFRPRFQERAHLEHVLGLRSGRFRIAATGRIVKAKGFADLLEAFARLYRLHPESELLLIGGNISQDISPVQAEFLAQAERAGLRDALVVTGMTDRVDDYLATSDVFVIASYREGLPRALLEAMATELAVVATDIRGCREAVTHGENGYLFPPHDVAQLAAKLIELYEKSDLRTALGCQARTRAVTVFDERTYVARQVHVINRLVGHAARADSASTQPASGRATDGQTPHPTYNRA